MTVVTWEICLFVGFLGGLVWTNNKEVYETYTLSLNINWQTLLWLPRMKDKVKQSCPSRQLKNHMILYAP